MTSFFAIVGFLALQLGICALSLYLSGTRKHRMITRKNLFVSR